MFRLYAKMEGQKRFQAVDWKNGVQVGNLIHATIFTAEEVQKLMTVDLVHPDNSHIQLQQNTFIIRTRQRAKGYTSNGGLRLRFQRDPGRGQGLQLRFPRSAHGMLHCRSCGRIRGLAGVPKIQNPHRTKILGGRRGGRARGAENRSATD